MLTNVALITSLQSENKFYQLENTLPVLAMPICHIAPRAAGHFIIKKYAKEKLLHVTFMQAPYVTQV